MGTCRWCMKRPATDLHHCLIHRMNDKPELDCMENLMPVCRECHYSGEVNGWDARVFWWREQCYNIGHAHMVEWLNNLDLKIKPQFE